jgi:hypothetical protein
MAMPTPFDHALAAWRLAIDRVEALERGRPAYLMQAWCDASEARAYDQRIVAAKVMREAAYSEFRRAKYGEGSPAGRPVKLWR